jgi:hypothetical protein
VGLKSTRCLTFVATPVQAASVAERWRRVAGQRTVICLDEATLSVLQARVLFGDEVEVHGLSDMGLQASAIVEEALSLADDLFPEREGDLVARVERWMLESSRRWLLYAVHSVRLVQAAFERFQPDEVWLPEYKAMYLTISPDEQADNPLFFDLLSGLCLRARVKTNNPRPANRGERLKRTFLPMKFVVGQWLASLKNREAKDGVAGPPRPVLLTNLDNDLHRHFDLSKLGPTAKLMFAWLRAGENIVPLERFLERVALPETTKFGWLLTRTDEVDEIATPAGIRIRFLSGLRFLVSLLLRERQDYKRRTALEKKYGVPWWDLFDSGIPYIHRDCRLAGAFYCLYEYERTRAVLRRWKPQLVVIGHYWTDLPKLAAAEDLGIKAMMTSAGISFIKNNFSQRTAPIVCVYGDAEARRTKEFHPEVRVIRAGDVLVIPEERRPGISESQQKPPRILVVTSARLFGWWFGSLLFDYKIFVRAFRTLAAMIRKLPNPIEVVIKSHPVSDLHEVYDQMVSEFGDVFVEHRKAPISEGQIAEFDAAVVFSAATTFLAELIKARVPIIYFDGALTSFGKSYCDYQGLVVAEDAAEIVGKISRLIDPQQVAEREFALELGDKFLRRYVDLERRSFKSVIEEILNGDAIDLSHPLPSLSTARQAPLTGLANPEAPQI